MIVVPENFQKCARIVYRGLPLSRIAVIADYRYRGLPSSGRGDFLGFWSALFLMPALLSLD